MKKSSKPNNSGSVKKPARRKGTHSLYTNLTNKRRHKTDAKSRKKADLLATLPKTRLKRILYRLHPKRLVAYWFSKDGAIMALKIAGLGLAVFIVLILSVFAIFRKDLALGPDELTKRVQSRTTKFYDRTGQVLLYELYKDQQLTFVKPDQISDNMKWATVAIEDRDFYDHSGFDIRGIIRSVVSNVSGGGRQGASTITQQLARNVILEDATQYGIAGYTRKIKELILSIELERMYSKDEILNFYLNSISYGGTAYGVESAANRYFEKSAKDLTIAEAAYIATIPQQPSIYDKNSPSFEPEMTVNRWKTVINYMERQDYITSEKADEARKVDILAKIVPLRNVANIKAPHFVNDIIKDLEAEYGADNVRQGGWRVTTTVDWPMQQLAEKIVKERMGDVTAQNGNNAALVAVDVKTNQVLAMVGSRDYNYPGYGTFNAATSDLQPGSSLKPMVYSQLFNEGLYGPGSVLSDVKKCWSTWCPNNFDRGFRGNISIRQALAESRNIPAIKAAEIVGMGDVIDLAKSMGEPNIGCGGSCDNNLSLAIGGGTVHLDEHTAAYATFARGGRAKPEAKILKIEKSNGEVLKEWEDNEGEQVFGSDERGSQISYLVGDILSDAGARSTTFPDQIGFNPPGVRTAVKTGTTDFAKDGWMMGFTPKLAVGIWVGRNDGAVMNSTTHLQTGPMFSTFVEQAHKQIMSKPQYGWTANEWFTQPAGIQRLTIGGRSDLYPSWFKKPKEELKKYTVDKVSKRLATKCTPSAARESIEVSIVKDPRFPGSTNDARNVPGGYDVTKKDNVHKCGDAQPSISDLSHNKVDDLRYIISASISKGKGNINKIELIVNGQVISTHPNTNNFNRSYTFPSEGQYNVQIRVTDHLYYQTTRSITVDAED